MPAIGNAIGIPFRRGGTSWQTYWTNRTPSGLALTVVSDTEIDGTFTINGTGQDGHKVYISTDGTTFTLLETLIGIDNTFESTGLTAGNIYFYYVKAYKGTNESPASDTVNATISTLLSNLVFSSKWNGSQFINAVTGLAMVDHGSVASADPIVTNSAISGRFVTASNKYLSTPHTTNLSMGDTDFMIAMWCNITSIGTVQILASKSLSAGNKREWALWATQGDANEIVFTVSADGVSWVNVDSVALSSNTDYFVLAWHNSVANTINIQINNGTIYSTAHAGGVFVADSDLAIGAVANPALYAGADISIDIWKGRLLNAGEIAAMWGGGTGNKHPFSSIPSKIILMGDKSGSESLAVSQAINTVLMAQNPHIIIGTGDYNGETLTTTQLLTNINVDMFASPGNHDDWEVGTRTEFNNFFNGGGYKKISIPYVDFFIYDFYLKMDESGYNDLLDSYAVTLASRQASVQGQWLINGLANSTAKWKIVVMHNPPHASPSDFGTPGYVIEAVGMKWDWSLLGADLLVCGHFHFYERLLVNTGSGNVPILIIGNTGTIDSLGRTSTHANSVTYFNEVTDTDFEGGMLVEMNVTEDALTIDLSAIKADYSVVTGKDQLVLA